ncbi:MAG TPA: GDP-mannose 4,6-dehydratase [Polyangiaceae bacterium]|nr:GDP-mannose 4,6-dehydratase [Polyangiaceae bacterium]
MKVLVTGADGFVGRHLSRALRRAGHEVVEPGPPHVAGGLELTSRESTLRVVADAMADAVIHLAAMSSVAESHKDPGTTFAVNALGTTHLLAAVHASTPKARVLYVSSGEVYGRVAGDAPATESTPLLPLSPYAASKVAAESVCFQFRRSYGTDVVCARPYNHLGPGQAPNFVVPSFAGQIAAIQRAESPPVLRTGDLGAVRDFSHVDDVVAAYTLLIERGVSGETYNVATGVGRTIQSLLTEMLELTGTVARVEVDPARVRPAEIPAMIGDASRLRALGWSPVRTARDALAEVLQERGAELRA